MALQPGVRIGPYEVIAPLGAGGMGEVYRARDPRLGREVAVKILPESVAHDRDRLARFEREARALAALNHPNILAIHDFGQDANRVFAVTELLQGETLSERLVRESLPVRKALDYARQIARGLAAAHDKGVIHRDIKPDNLFVTRDGHLKILDFGLARQSVAGFGADTTTRAAPATGPGTVLGTVGYMSPEQVRGESADHRSDIFSFGAVLYEMLAGQRAFAGDSAVDTLHAILRSDPPEVAALQQIAPSVVRVVRRCLEKQQHERFQSAHDLAFALEAVDEPSAQSGTMGAAPRKSLRRVAAAVLIALLVAGLLGWWTLTRTGRAKRVEAATAQGDPARLVIAVLPFENLSADDRQAYFGAGMTEEIMSQLSKISTLRVISRAAVATFTNAPGNLQRLANELRVGSVVTGSVRQAASRVRVGVQLVDPRSGETRWAEQYDRELQDIFAVQSDVAIRVANSLRAALTPTERTRVEKKPTDDVVAYQLYLRTLTMTELDREKNLGAVDLLRQAIGRDPRFALAYAHLARRYSFASFLGNRADLEKGVQAARQALRLDNQLPQAHHALALNQLQLGQVEEARLALTRAIELDPSFSTAMFDLSVAESNSGYQDRALYWARRAFPLAPNRAVSYYHVGVPLVFLDDGVAERWLRRTEELYPQSQRTQILFAILDFGRGRDTAALTRIRRSVGSAPTNQEGQILLAELSALLGAPDAEALVDQLFRQSPEARGWITPYTARTLRAWLWLRRSEIPRGRALLQAALAANEQAMKSGDRSPYPPMENVAIQVLLGNRREAIQWLDRAAAAKWSDAKSTSRDPLLAPLRDEPRFKEFLARINTEIDEQRRRADFSGLDDLPPK